MRRMGLLVEPVVDFDLAREVFEQRQKLLDELVQPVVEDGVDVVGEIVPLDMVCDPEGARPGVVVGGEITEVVAQFAGTERARAMARVVDLVESLYEKQIKQDVPEDLIKFLARNAYPQVAPLNSLSLHVLALTCILPWLVPG